MAQYGTFCPPYAGCGDPPCEACFPPGIDQCRSALLPSEAGFIDVINGGPRGLHFPTFH